MKMSMWMWTNLKAVLNSDFEYKSSIDMNATSSIHQGFELAEEKHE